MNEFPDHFEVEKLSEACDRMMARIRRMPKAEEMTSDDIKDLEALILICRFIYKIKHNIEFIETMVCALKNASPPDSEQKNQNKVVFTSQTEP